ncbi:XopAF/AvrXv3 family type III secretion system effector [Pseudomonas syringae group genomosp. 3]|uniref:XopAF/AvrXv3 family type III secretion system effector n=1 Tax=Pseudomonas syringae group genomosp. 3 TaxID=251701 RepID=UPI00218019EC|nr:XopAF/AvrXv3 family type III secretion system effector [Pseudomonas syringae group genomosp. 3]
MGLCISSSSGNRYNGNIETPTSSPDVRATAGGHRTASTSRGALDELSETPAKFSHYQLARRGGDYTLRMVSLSAYQAERRHVGDPIKDRSGSMFPWVRVYNKKTGLDYSFEIDRSTRVKVAGFNGLTPNDEETRHLYSAGTSQINMPVVTDKMTACIAVAIAAENVHADTGERMSGAKVRVFHLLPFCHEDLVPEQVLSSMRDYVRDTRALGLTMRVAMHGGDREGDFSLSTADALKELFASEGIPLEFDETCAGRSSDTLLGAVILDDNSTRFIKHLVTA